MANFREFLEKNIIFNEHPYSLGLALSLSIYSYIYLIIYFYLSQIEHFLFLLDVMTKRLGQEATLFKLSVEFLLLNRREQAKPILETPGLRYNQKVNLAYL